ncbi:MAG: hypothetical protein EOM68_29605, partial [Spirochaetia bacterium]|nr:hypothetical protein [Spirochaetia bacterium]
MSNTNSIFTMYDVPVIRALDSISMKTFQLLMGCGTIDPVNPSLLVLGLERTGKLYEAGMLILELSPLSVRVMEVGKADLGDLPNFEMNLEPLFALMGPACPSLLLSPTMLPPMIVEKLYHLYFRSRNDGWRLLEGVRCYPGNPFKRVRRELGARYKASDPLEDRRLESSEATELASLLLGKRAVDMEWKTFILSWGDAASNALDEDP